MDRIIFFSSLPPPPKQFELEVQKIIHLQNLTNRLPNAFIDLIKVTKSHKPAANIPTRIEIPMGSVANEPKPQLNADNILAQNIQFL